jgi:hypothetical protein
MRFGTIKISLCVTTYNSVLRLQQVLKNILVLSEMPDEVLICDDGSGQSTRNLVRWFGERMPVPVYHLWQPDLGWRPSRSRNNGIRHSHGDYIVFLDGDCVPHRSFIRDHRRNARRGSLILGDRAHVREEALEEFSPDFLSVVYSMLKNRIHKRSSAIRLIQERPVCKVYSEVTAAQLAHFAVGCNFSAWRSDLLRVNGFNEAITGWGLEDVELIARLMAIGLEARKYKHQAIVYHLDHGVRPYDEVAVLHPVRTVFEMGTTVAPFGLSVLNPGK